MDFLTGIKNQNKKATARLMTLVERDDPKGIRILKNLYLLGGSAYIIGVTGSPGSGKSSIINRLIGYYRKEKKKIGVIAIDPTSLYSGGAILGDRVRMTDYTLDKDVFIRSMATREHLGGLAPKTMGYIHILDAYGCDIIIIETVGIGQSEQDIVDIADTTLVVLNPGMGDDVQTLKAGILESADIFVLNKSDIDGKDQVKHLLLNMIKLDKKLTPVIETIASESENNGISELVNAIYLHRQNFQSSDDFQKQKEFRAIKELQIITKIEILKKIFERLEVNQRNELIAKIVTREIDPYTVSQQIIEEFQNSVF